ncbi:MULTISPECIES: hypothetical protein [Methanothrix]|jgi:hypothetical protein|uniref:hypothetical protein n=1 Tax=Methanothrix TaxID=2222 RepID=UPI001B7CD89F|nr:MULTISPECIES: hypothetical protein [unclassified Methanothrix]MBP7067347.1 hypothetical protein [Methanothrix sp.]HRD16341.1 hypothetical protein [Methanothrix soehngenii]
MKEGDVNEFKEKIHNGSIDTAFPGERHRCGCGIFPGKRAGVSGMTPSLFLRIKEVCK